MQLRPNRDHETGLDDLPVKSIEDIDLDALDPDDGEDMADGTVFRDGEEGFSVTEEDVSLADEMTVAADEMSVDSDMAEFPEEDDPGEGEDDSGEDVEDDGTEELADPLGDVVHARSGPTIAPRIAIIDRDRRVICFPNAVDFIKCARMLAAEGVELYE